MGELAGVRSRVKPAFELAANLRGVEGEISESGLLPSAQAGSRRPGEAHVQETGCLVPAALSV